MQRVGAYGTNKSTWEDLRKSDQKRALVSIGILGEVNLMPIILTVDLFGVADFMSDRSASPAIGTIRALYGCFEYNCVYFSRQRYSRSEAQNSGHR